MTGVVRHGSVPEISVAWGFPHDFANEVAVKKAFTGTAATGLLLEADTMYLLQASEDCFVKFGSANTVAATTSSFHLPMFRGVPYLLTAPGAACYFSVVQNDTAGNLYLTKLESI